MTHPSTYPECAICGGEASYFTERGGYTIVCCNSCGFKWMHPMTVPSYDMAESGGLGVGYFGKAKSKIRRCLRRAKVLKRALGSRSERPRLLDVGSNVGYFCEAARMVGFEAVGVEPDSASVAAAREAYPKNEYHNGTLESVSLTGPFDVVYTSEVVEHVPDPNAFIESIAGLLRPHGLLYITTPDVEHWTVRNKPPAEREMFSPPAHCLYFSPSTLRMLLEKHGFKVIKKAVAFKPGIKMLAVRKP